MKLEGRIAQDMVYCMDRPGERYETGNLLFELVSEQIYDTSRWSITYLRIYKEVISEKFYRTFYSVGATEYQDESPYEYEDSVVFDEVIQVPVQTYQYMTQEEFDRSCADDK